MQSPSQVSTKMQGNAWHVTVGGEWNIESPWPPDATQAFEGLERPEVKALSLSSEELGHWDSSLLVFLVQLVQSAKSRKLPVQMFLAPGLERLVQMAFAVPPRAGAQQKREPVGKLAELGTYVLGLPQRFKNFLFFIGSVAVSFACLFTGKSRMRSSDFISALFECGVQSLPIISLTTLLFGLILAFVGAVQLTQFGAQIYVAGLVGIGMLRVMGAVMVGVVMSGRTGAAYAALLGTMQVNEEIDALETLGISPIDFLVLPRLLALTIMVPLLTLYADIMGIGGGFLVATLMLGINPMEYFLATTHMVAFRQVLIGLVYGTVFGIVIAVAACYQGMQCGRSAEAVGRTTTMAVVHSIVGIIVATAIITIICNVLGV